MGGPFREQAGQVLGRQSEYVRSGLPEQPGWRQTAALAHRVGTDEFLLVAVAARITCHPNWPILNQGHPDIG